MGILVLYIYKGLTTESESEESMLPIDNDGLEKAKQSLFFSDKSKISDDVIENGLNITCDLIPYVDYVNKARKGLVFISDQLFYRKLALFIKNFNDGTINFARVSDFRALLEDDPKYTRKVIEFLLVYLDRFDEVIKAKILAEFVKNYVDFKIDWELLVELTACLDRLFISDTLILKSIDAINSDTVAIKDLKVEGLSKFRIYSAVNRLISIGLVNLNQRGFSWDVFESFENSNINISKLGKLFSERGNLTQI